MSCVALVRGFRRAVVRLSALAAVVLATVLVGPVSALPPVSEAPPASDSPPVSEAPPVFDRADQIQILGVDESPELVVLDLAVPPSIGELTPGPSDFGVSDNGRLVDFVVEPVSTGLDIVVVLDTSGSMRGSALDAAKSAAAQFIEALPTDTRVGLISFDELVDVRRTPTEDRSAVLADLRELSATGNETAIWDALVQAVDVVGDRSDRSRSIIVLSDGEDTASVTLPDQLVERLGRSGSALYAVAIESPESDLVVLESVVGAVGGQFLATEDFGQLEQLYGEIAGRLSNRYRIRFEPQTTDERTVVVSVGSAAGVATVRTVVGQGGPAVVPSDPGPGADLSPAPGAATEERGALGVVSQPALGWLGHPVLQWVGLFSIFAAICVGVWALSSRPSTGGIRLDAAAGADQLVGLNARIGHAADRFIAEHDQRRRFDSKLEAANISMRPGEFVLGWVVLSALAVIAFSTLLGLTMALLLVPLSAVAALTILNSRASRRQAAFADQLTETLSIMASSLRAGQSLPRAVELVAAEAPSPTADQFHRISFEVRVGRDLTDSIQDAAARMDNDDLAWLAEAVDIHRELGGDLTEILDNVSDTIRERRTVARQVKALSAEGRATGWVLLVMPLLLFLLTWWRTPRAVEVMVTEGLGRLLLALALAGMVVGHLWIRRLVKFAY